MERSIYKYFVIAIWVLLVFGYLYLMQIVYEKEQSFYLFVLLTLAGNLAYDGLKALLKYQSFYESDARALAFNVAMSVICLFMSVAVFFVGAALNIYFSFPEALCKGIALSGNLVCIGLGLNYIAKAERTFQVSQSSRIFN